MKQAFYPEGTLFERPENREALASLAAMERAMQQNTVLEYPVASCDGDLYLHLDLPACHGIIPPKEALLCREGERRKDIAVISRVGKPTAFCIQSIEERNGRPTAILSRRKAQSLCYEEYLSHCTPGDLVLGQVTHMESFGAFLDVGCGVPSLLSVDCISVSRISHPAERLTAGQTLPVVVRSIDRATGRIYVTLRELLGTWEENAAAFTPGETVTGIIRSVEPYGIFVELAPNLAGLAEVREDAIEAYREKIGCRAAVYIKSILPERMKIKLVLIDTLSSRQPTPPLRLCVDPQSVQHVSRWVYSPAGAKKLVETVFDEI